MLPEFLPGLSLASRFYHEAVRPLLDRDFSGLAHSAGLIGYGSDVIGCDDLISTDHMWGPRLYLFIDPDAQALIPELNRQLAEHLPDTVAGWPTHFSPPDPQGIRCLEPRSGAELNPLIWIQSPEAFFRSYLGIWPLAELTSRQWLTLPEHRLLAVTAGELFHDDLNLGHLRAELAYYPEPLRLYLMASLWAQISEEQAFVGRCGHAGDELGSALITARLIQQLMRLGFVLERRYAPYSKWFGSLFKRLKIAQELQPLLEKTLAASDWQTRQQALTQAGSLLIRASQVQGIAPDIDPEPQGFHGRPYLVVDSEGMEKALKTQIIDPDLKGLPAIGSLSHASPQVRLYDELNLSARFRAVYGPEPASDA